MPLAAVPPQALQKFNLAKQPVSAIPNTPFTSHSSEKREPRRDDDCCGWAKICRKQAQGPLNAYDSANQKESAP
jgi:hypothetical protein